MGNIIWPRWLDDTNKDYDPCDEKRYRMHRRYSIILSLVRKFYEEHWPGSWRKLRRRFEICGLEIVGEFRTDGDYQHALEKCVVCGSTVSPYYRLYGFPLNSQFSYPGSTDAPLPKSMPLSLSFSYFKGNTTRHWSTPEFAICINGHAFMHFETHNTASFGMISYHRMWSKKEKRLVAFRSEEIDPYTGTKHPSSYYEDEIKQLQEEYSHPLVGRDRYARPANLTDAILSNEEIEGIERIIQHMVQIRSLSNVIHSASYLAIACPERIWLPQEQIEWLWDQIKKELRRWIKADHVINVCELAIGAAFVHPQKALELQQEGRFIAFLKMKAREIVRFNQEEGWRIASMVGIAIRLYCPCFIEEQVDFCDALWHKGSRRFLPQLKRGFQSYIDELAYMRLIFPDRFTEICPTGEDFQYVIRRSLMDLERAREEVKKEKKDGQTLLFTLHSVLREIVYIKLVTAKK